MAAAMQLLCEESTSVACSQCPRIWPYGNKKSERHAQAVSCQGKQVEVIAGGQTWGAAAARTRTGRPERPRPRQGAARQALTPPEGPSVSPKMRPVVDP